MVLDAFILQHIQLCDWYTAGSVQCQERNGGCAGAVNGNCYPYAFWSNTFVADSQRYAYDFAGGSFYPPFAGHGLTNALSVRLFYLLYCTCFSASFWILYAVLLAALTSKDTFFKQSLVPPYCFLFYILLLCLKKMYTLHPLELLSTLSPPAYYSCATGILQALCSATPTMAAVRAHLWVQAGLTTATQITFGQAVRSLAEYIGFQT